MEEKKVALVTGASTGIGRAIAIELARQGMTVVVNYNRSENKAKQTLEIIKSIGATGVAYKANVSNENEVSAMIAAIKKRFNKLDVVVNNAGIIRDGYLIMMETDSFIDVLNTNLLGCFFCTKAALRLMCAQKEGVILNIASTSGLIGQSGQANYSASKGGIISFTKSVAKEYAKYNIRANVICPGFINTEMTKSNKSFLMDNYGGLIPLGRFGEPEEIAHAAAFLTSEKASYITGQILTVDGGLVM